MLFSSLLSLYPLRAYQHRTCLSKCNTLFRSAERSTESPQHVWISALFDFTSRAHDTLMITACQNATCFSILLRCPMRVSMLLALLWTFSGYCKVCCILMGGFRQGDWGPGRADADGVLLDPWCTYYWTWTTLAMAVLRVNMLVKMQ